MPKSTIKRSLKIKVRTINFYLVLWMWIHLVWKHALSKILKLSAASVKTADTGACHLPCEKSQSTETGWQHRRQKRMTGALIWENYICTFTQESVNMSLNVNINDWFVSPYSANLENHFIWINKIYIILSTFHKLRAWF